MATLPVWSSLAGDRISAACRTCTDARWRTARNDRTYWIGLTWSFLECDFDAKGSGEWFSASSVVMLRTGNE